jgi:hypothetical protein
MGAGPRARLGLDEPHLYRPLAQMQILRPQVRLRGQNRRQTALETMPGAVGGFGMRKKIQPKQPTLFKKNYPLISVLNLGGKTPRSHQFTYGLDAVCDELSVNIHKIVTPENINESDIVLCSFCSTADILEFVNSVNENPTSKLVIGGQGVYPFTAWRHLADRIVFGRSELSVDKCVLTDEKQDWWYDYSKDPNIKKNYTIRQPRKILTGENSVGCNGKCKFCQYSATRKKLAGDYNPGNRGHKVTEDRWQNIISQTGPQTTALDGWSEQTRKKVGKPISDEQIIETLSKVLSDVNGTMRLKVFQIVGYPWEDERSLKEDILNFRNLLSKVRPGNGRIMMMILTTPFSPEPLTEFENEAANIESNWRGILLSDEFRCIFDSKHINAFSLPQIAGPLTLYKRVMTNRCDNIDRLIRVSNSKNIDDAVKIGGNIHLENQGFRISNILETEKKR